MTYETDWANTVRVYHHLRFFMVDESGSLSVSPWLLESFKCFDKDFGLDTIEEGLSDVIMEGEGENA